MCYNLQTRNNRNRSPENTWIKLIVCPDIICYLQLAVIITH